MARNTKPLNILVDITFTETPEYLDLIHKGHNVFTSDFTRYDIVIAENAWRIPSTLRKNLDIAIKSARAVRYPKKEKVLSDE